MDHVDFDFGINNFIDASKQGNTPIVPDPNKRTIIFSSLQDFARMTEGGFKEKFSNFPELTFDLLVKDECHLHFDTIKTKEAISQLNCKHILNLSGTPFQALWEERFMDDAKFTWSYINEQFARAQEIDKLGRELAEKEGQYYWLCPMKIFTILLSAELYEESEQFTDDEGFTFTKLFAVEDKNGKYAFRNDTAVRAFVNSICRGFIMPYSKQAHNSHQYTSINLKHAIWYVPGVKEANMLAAMLRKHDTFKHYDIIIAAGHNGDEGNDTVKLVETRIADIESGRNKRHIGTITLTCGKLSHGVSIPEWGSVLNLSDMKSAQLYFQLIFRAQTPCKNGPKHECYVFDFNPNRTLTHIHTLAEATAGTNNIMPVLSEMLNVFNVLCYEGTDFKQVKAEELIEKLESGFGRSTSLLGLQSLFSELPFEWDTELGEELCDIEGIGNSKVRDIDVNRNDSAPNGKNTKRRNGDSDYEKSDDDDEDADANNDNDEELSEDQKKARIKIALKAVPLYLFFTGDDSFDGLVNNLSANQNSIACKTITGLLARSLKKILITQPQEKKQIISQGITRFRALESKDHNEFCKLLPIDNTTTRP